MKVSQSWATGFEDWVLLLIGACFTIDYVIQRLFRIGETPMGPFRRPIQTEPDGDEEEPPGVPESRWEYERQMKQDRKAAERRERRAVLRRMKKEASYPNLVERILNKDDDSV